MRSKKTIWKPASSRPAVRGGAHAYRKKQGARPYHAGGNHSFDPDRPAREDPAKTTAARPVPAAVPAAAAPHPRRHPIRAAFAVLGSLVAMLLIFCFGAVSILCLGPSPAARDLFVNTVMETSAAKFLARIYFSPEEIQQILDRNAVVEQQAVTEKTEFTPQDPAEDTPEIELVEVSGATFKGKMLIVRDPSRVKLSVAPVFDPDLPGLRVEEHAEQSGAVATINGGGFLDEGGVGTGGMPLGLVIKDGVLLSGGKNTRSTIVGFDADNQLIVGTLTGQECLDRGIRDAVAFGPAFIVNGEPMDVAGSGGGLNPRTALGQRADGAVLMLVIDGRQASSIGATYKDCIDVMLEYGAINAGNLDGGSSSMLVYEGEVQNVCASLYGSRPMPTAFVVI